MLNKQNTTESQNNHSQSSVPQIRLTPTLLLNSLKLLVFISYKKKEEISHHIQLEFDPKCLHLLTTNPSVTPALSCSIQHEVGGLSDH